MNRSLPFQVPSACFVGGEWISSQDNRSIDVVDPATRQVIGAIPLLTQSQIVSAVDHAQAAFRDWRDTALDVRVGILRRWGELLLEHRTELAQLLSLEQGKPQHEALGEIGYAASFLPWFAEQARRLDGRTIPSHIPGAQLGTLIEPVGVAALITPWNFPSAMITRKAAAALAAGCTVVVKPAHETPYSALALARLAEEAGCPAGVFNVVIGDPQMAMETLVSDRRVRAVSFTGSTRVGQRVLEACGGDVKKVALELGGNAPFIVCADADVDRAVDFAINAKFQTSGQDCCAADRLLVHRSLYPEFVSRFAAAASRLIVGPASDARSQIGPLMHQAAFDTTRARLAQALETGATLVTGGDPHPLGGWYHTPTVLADVTPQMRIWHEETFAPIVGVMPFDHLEEAIALANDSEYGLAGYICSERLDSVWQLIRALEVAMVSVNGARFTGPPVPFGGTKASGLGREGGSEGFEPFVETKYFCLHIGAQASPQTQDLAS